MSWEGQGGKMISKLLYLEMCLITLVVVHQNWLKLIIRLQVFFSDPGAPLEPLLLLWFPFPSRTVPVLRVLRY